MHHPNDEATGEDVFVIDDVGGGGAAPCAEGDSTTRVIVSRRYWRRLRLFRGLCERVNLAGALRVLIASDAGASSGPALPMMTFRQSDVVRVSRAGRPTVCQDDAGFQEAEVCNILGCCVRLRELLRCDGRLSSPDASRTLPLKRKCDDTLLMSVDAMDAAIGVMIAAKRGEAFFREANTGRTRRRPRLSEIRVTTDEMPPRSVRICSVLTTKQACLAGDEGMEKIVREFFGGEPLDLTLDDELWCPAHISMTKQGTRGGGGLHYVWIVVDLRARTVTVLDSMEDGSLYARGKRYAGEQVARMASAALGGGAGFEGWSVQQASERSGGNVFQANGHDCMFHVLSALAARLLGTEHSVSSIVRWREVFPLLLLGVTLDPRICAAVADDAASDQEEADAGELEVLLARSRTAEAGRVPPVHWQSLQATVDEGYAALEVFQSIDAEVHKRKAPQGITAVVACDSESVRLPFLDGRCI